MALRLRPKSTGGRATSKAFVLEKIPDSRPELVSAAACACEVQIRSPSQDSGWVASIVRLPILRAACRHGRARSAWERMLGLWRRTCILWNGGAVRQSR